MRLFEIAVVAFASGVSAVKQTEHDKLAARGLEKLRADIARNGYPNPEKCTMENVAVRKEWCVSEFVFEMPDLTNLSRSQLSKPDRRNFIDAMKCLHSKPTLTPASVAPGARSRFDDFIVTHILQPYSIHATVSRPQ